MTEAIEITLEQLLDAREKRAVKQKKLIEKLAVPVVSFTINMPGACKKTPVSCSVFRAGYAALMQCLKENYGGSVFSEAHALDTGYEALIAVDTDERAMKEKLLQLEEAHPLGRLFDFDVIGLDGNAVSREAIGYPKRKCLVCEEDAHACGRSRRHSVEVLLEKIQSMVVSNI